MDSIKSKLLALAAFDEQESQDYADNLDSSWDKPNAYAHHLAGAYYVHDNLLPLITAMAEELEAVMESMRAMSDLIYRPMSMTDAESMLYKCETKALETMDRIDAFVAEKVSKP